MTKPIVLLGVDVPGWALENNALQLQRRLINEFDVQIANVYSHPEPCDVLVVMWWPGLDKFVNRARPKKIIVGFNGTSEWQSAPAPILARAAGLANAVYALNQDSATRLQTRLQRKVHVCHDGVDLGMFPLLPLPKTFAVGWNGNLEHGPIKGVDIIEEACRIAGVPLVLRTRPAQPEPHANVLAFYQQISVLACASESEGTPLPVLEALACGRPVISTAVGIVPELLATGHSPYDPDIVSRTPKAFATAIIERRDSSFLEMWNETGIGRSIAATRSWDSTVGSWRNMIWSVL